MVKRYLVAITPSTVCRVGTSGVVIEAGVEETCRGGNEVSVQAERKINIVSGISRPLHSQA
jgi:hypothetical protein